MKKEIYDINSYEMIEVFGGKDQNGVFGNIELIDISMILAFISAQTLVCVTGYVIGKNAKRRALLEAAKKLD